MLLYFHIVTAFLFSLRQKFTSRKKIYKTMEMFGNFVMKYRRVENSEMNI